MTNRTIMAAAAIAAIFFSSVGTAHAAPPIERTEYDLLGTTCMIRLYAGGSNATLDASFARLAEIEKHMTINKPGSEVDAVNDAAGRRPVKVSADVLHVVEVGLQYSEDGDGAFDITVEPLVKLWGIGTDAARVPSEKEIRGALSRIGYKDLVVNDKASTVFLKRPGMGIDLGSVAKGWAADEVVKVLHAHGVTSALIDLGGNVLTYGTKPDGAQWRIAIQDPEKARGTMIGYVDIPGGSVTTAGTYERYFERDGKRYFHILDARTGYPAWNGLSAVAIWAPDSTTADGYDTLAFTLGLEHGSKLVESTHGRIEAVFITEKKGVYVTPGLRSRFTLTSPDYTMMR
ncbi:MAG TPA: FAD:protein FMN transferase [Spirochaetia bacterium]